MSDGYRSSAGKSEAFGAYVRGEVDKYGAVVKQAGLAP